MLPLETKNIVPANKHEGEAPLSDYVLGRGVMTLKIFESDVDNYDIVLRDMPTMGIYKIRRIGKLSFF